MPVKWPKNSRGSIFNGRLCVGASDSGAPGFTLIELMVAVTILALMAGLVVVNFAGLRVGRNLTIAQNELVTNIRKVQSYTLSGRLVSGNQEGQVYILKFDGSAGHNTTYSLQALYNVSSSPTLVSNVETYQLPPGIFLSTVPVVIYRDPVKYSPVSQVGPCALIAFKTPFAKTYFNGAAQPPPGSTASVGSGCYVSSPAFQPNTDDYANIINYATNANGYPTSTDSFAVITLTDSTGTQTKQVMVRGVTGVVCPTNDGVNCSN